MFSYTNISAYHTALRNGTTTCEAAVMHYLAAINEHQELNALVHVFEAEALATARRLDLERTAGQAMGALHGVVVTIKDVLCYQHHPVSAASRILNQFTSLYSATAVERLLQAGAIIIGINNCDEFAMGSSNENSCYGPVKNQRDPGRVPGGSSGGSAVAVQAGLCMVSLGSDTGGSVRQPADFCGIIGLKPTYGRISRYGLIAYGSSFDQVGILANNVSDVALVLGVLAGADGYDATASQQPVPDYSAALAQPLTRKPVIGILRQTLYHPSLDPEIAAAIQQLISRLQAAGYTIKELEFDLLDYIVPTYYVLTTAEASSNLSRYDGVRYGPRVQPSPAELTEFYAANRSAGFGTEVQRRILLGTFVLSAGYYDAYFTKAQQVRQQLLDRTMLIFNDIDILLMPVSPTVAWKLAEKKEDPVEMYLADIFTVFANLTGIPGIALPLFEHSTGMPFGIQLMARHFDELSLLQLSQQWLTDYKQQV